jgi:uncharacterized protein
MTGSIMQSRLLALMLLTLNACASPREHYYLLAQPALENSVPVAKSSTVLVGPVAIPAEIDRAQIVVRKGNHEVAINEQERWAVPLKEALPRLLAEELSRYFKYTRFVPVVSGISSAAKAQIAIDVTTFEVSYETGATVSLHWVYRSGTADRPPVEGDATAHSPVEKGSIESLLDGLRRATMEAADSIAKRLPDHS